MARYEKTKSTRWTRSGKTASYFKRQDRKQARKIAKQQTKQEA